MTMKHFVTEEWVDYVNQAGSQEKRNEMQAHLNSGCKHCEKAASLWQKVHRVASGEAGFQPPVDATRMVKTAYFTAGYPQTRKLRDIVAEAIFDSYLAPATAGVRSSGSLGRQILYKADPYQIDVQIESKPGESRICVTGQLMDVSRPGIVGSDVRVTLSNRRGNVVQTVTNKFGEFRGEIENLGDLELRIQGAADRHIVVSLRDALRGTS